MYTSITGWSYNYTTPSFEALTKDREFMEEVADYFKQTKKEDHDGSINDTALHFNITRTKARKILITMGSITSEITSEALNLKDQGYSNKEIAAELGLSESTVSTYMPYDGRIYNSPDASRHAMEVRAYREYEKKVAEKQAAKKKTTASIGKEQANMKEDVMLKAGNGVIPEDWKKGWDDKLSRTPENYRRPRMKWGDKEKRYSIYVEQGESDEEDNIVGGLKESNAKSLAAMRDKMNKGETLSNQEQEYYRNLVYLEGRFPGALFSRNVDDLADMYGEKMPFEPDQMMRLHLEVLDLEEKDKETLHKYGNLEGNTISRDIIVSSNLPLYALHYVIQRAFGWQNSHLHNFCITKESREKITKTTQDWVNQVGYIYRSPYMNENAEFWADDYKSGSFKNWLRKKYTEPCVSQNWAEGVVTCKKDMKRIDLEDVYTIEWGSYLEKDAPAIMNIYPKDKPLKPFMIPLMDKEVMEHYTGRMREPYHHRLEEMKFKDIPVDDIHHLFYRATFDILERLSIGEVLIPHMDKLDGDLRTVRYTCGSWEKDMEYKVKAVMESGRDTPMDQPSVSPFTDELYYTYDFGDSWRIKITGSMNCVDLVESGKITQEDLDKSNIKARVTYRPVMIARDGEMLIDVVGGPSGMARFLKDINSGRGYRDENGMTKTELKAWAKSQGWHKDDSSNFNLL